MVGTLMTNLALELALAKQGIGLKRTAVGDKYVLEEMLRLGISLGGEASGHIIFADLSLAGDGMITLLQVLRLLAETGRPAGIDPLSPAPAHAPNPATELCSFPPSGGSFRPPGREAPGDR